MKKFIVSVIMVLALCSFAPNNPFNVKGKKVTFRIENRDSSAVDIKVTDAFGRDVYSETVQEKNIGKLFNFEKAFPNTYTIVIKDGDTTYTKILEVN